MRRESEDERTEGVELDGEMVRGDRGGEDDVLGGFKAVCVDDVCPYRNKCFPFNVMLFFTLCCPWRSVKTGENVGIGGNVLRLSVPDPASNTSSDWLNESSSLLCSTLCRLPVSSLTSDLLDRCSFLPPESALWAGSG